jgi:hypothetical protein
LKTNELSRTCSLFLIIFSIEVSTR